MKKICFSFIYFFLISIVSVSCSKTIDLRYNTLGVSIGSSNDAQANVQNEYINENIEPNSTEVANKIPEEPRAECELPPVSPELVEEEPVISLEPEPLEPAPLEPEPPEVEEEPTDIGVGNEYALALKKKDGTVMCFGDDTYGGDCSSVEGLENVVSIAATEGAFAAIKEEDGVRSVVTWGNMCFGGDFTFSDEYTFCGTLVSKAQEGSLSSGIVSIAATEGAFAVIKEEDGVRSVVTWGDKNYGGDFNYFSDEYTLVSKATEGSLSSGVVSLYSNRGAFAVIKKDGSVVTWGRDDHGGNSTETYGGDLSSGVVAIYSSSSVYGGAFAAIKEDENHVRSVVTWGDKNFGGNITYSDEYDVAKPSEGALSSGIVSIYSTTDRYGNGGAFAAIKEENGVRSVVTWGSKDHGGDSTETHGGALSSGIVEVVSNDYAFAAIKEENGVRSVITWGYQYYGGNFDFYDDGMFMGDPIKAAPEGSLSSGIVSIHSTNTAFAAIKEEGGVRSVITWGYSTKGGDSSNVDLSSGVVGIYSIDSAFTVIKEEDGVRSIVAFGSTYTGGDPSNIIGFTESSDLSTITNIFSNDRFFVGIREDYSYVVWGAY